MRFRTRTFISAWKALITNKARSALTILGIVIGIMSIIIVMAVGQGGQDLILSEIESLGSNTLRVAPGRESQGPSDVNQFYLDSIGQKEMDAILNESRVPHVVDVMPFVVVPGSVSYQGETMYPQMYGTNHVFEEHMDGTPNFGIFFDEDMVKTRDRVAVIGSDVEEELFGDESGLNKKIKIGDQKLRVIGVFGDKGQSLFMNFDKSVIVPHTTAMQYITGQQHFNEIIVRAESDEHVEQVRRDIQLTLREMHDIEDPEDDDFQVNSQEDLMQMIGTITGVLKAILVSVAAISLLVGGVGIMNIMLVSVTERTREIGLRKAVGARQKDILRQFLIEAVMLTAAGGAIGIAIGTGITFLVSVGLSQGLNLNWQFSFPWGAAALGLFVSATIGLIFGYFPARAAAKKHPIEALRFE
ncbi:MAG: hypothetical protein CMI52_04275 [Parcubacteria group bacterium]|nr:hypothetical protein [Parcubacteria group bacterium]